MTRVTAHALGDDRIIVCGDDGRRWILDAPAAAIDSDAARAALDEVRHSGPDVEILGLGSVEVDSIRGLRALASGVDRGTGGEFVALWRYAGIAHRVRLVPGDAAATAGLVESVLRASVGDAAAAAALVEPPLHADPLDIRPGKPGDAGGEPLRDTLERCEEGRWAPHPLRPAPIVDPVTGVLRRIVARPAESWHPVDFHHLHAELPHLSSVDPRFQPDVLAPAGAFAGGPDDPERAAVLSGVAHYCGAYLGQGELRRATARELRAAGERVLTVAEWRPHDPRLHQRTGFPFVRDDDDAANAWLAGDEGGEVCWVPLSLVHAGYLSSGLDLPATNDHNLVGLRAGTDLADATDRASAHVIAHDAVARWWRSPVPLPECVPPSALLGGRDASPLTLRVLAIPSPTGFPVRLVVADDPSADIVGLGFAAASDPDEAAVLAAAEALVQHASARDLNAPRSLIRDAESLGNGGVAGLAPYDPDRRYAETAYADPRRLIDPMCHVQYGLSRSSVTRVRERTSPRGTAPSETTNTSAYAALLASGARVVVVDVTTERVREAGFAACRVLAPGLQRLTTAAFPASIGDAPPYPGW